MREQLHNQLINACEYFLVLDNFDQAITAAKKEEHKIIQEQEEKHRQICHQTSFGGWISCLIATGIVLGLLIQYGLAVVGCGGAVLLSFLGLDESSALFNTLSNLLGTFFSLSCPLWFAGLIFTGIFIPVSILIFKKTYCAKKNKKNAEEADAYWAEVEPARKEARECVEKLAEERKQFVSDNKQCLHFLPEAYRCCLAVSFMEQAIRNGRADNLKELINLYEEQLHRWTLEDQGRELLQQAELQRVALQRQLAQISDQQRRSANTLRNIQAMQIYNSFYNAK